jgi:hypothetical protein
VASRDGSPDVVQEFREFCGPADPEIGKVLRPRSLRAQFGIDKVGRFIPIGKISWLACTSNASHSYSVAVALSLTIRPAFSIGFNGVKSDDRVLLFTSMDANFCLF